MLVSSGLGSFVSSRMLGRDEGRLIKALGLVALMTALLAIVVSSLLSALVWLPLGLKMVLTVVLIAPLGFVMGMPFPTGLTAAGGVARAERPLGVVAECGFERAGLGGRAGLRDLSGVGADADCRRPVLSGGAGDHRACAHERGAAARAGARARVLAQ